jgi:hypothetical protein
MTLLHPYFAMHGGVQIFGSSSRRRERCFSDDAEEEGTRKAKGSRGRRWRKSICPARTPKVARSSKRVFMVVGVVIVFTFKM